VKAAIREETLRNRRTGLEYHDVSAMRTSGCCAKAISPVVKTFGMVRK